MKIKNISYPYPVLGNANDVTGTFNSKLRYRLGNDFILLKVKFTLQNKTLTKLIKQKKAKYTIELECNSTFFRTTFSIYESEDQFQVKSERCRGLVTVKFYVRSTERIEGYKVDGCHEDYREFMETYPMTIEKGDVLALGPETSFIVDKGFDPMKPKVASFMAVEENKDKEEGPIEVYYYNQSRIIVKLPKKDFKRYVYLKGRKWVSPVIHSSVVLPVLVDTIRRIHDDPSEIEGNRWYEKLVAIIQQNEWPDDDPLYTAQMILKHPVNRFLEAVEQHDLIEEEDSNG